MFDWESYFTRIAKQERRERDAELRKELRHQEHRSITQTIRSCAPPIRRPRTSRPRDPRKAS